MFRTFMFVAGAAMAAGAAQAQSMQPPLIHPAVFGTVHEVTGATLPIVTPRAGCPAAAQPVPGGPCFDKVMTHLAPNAGQVRVLALNVPAQSGSRITGMYGRDFTLFDVRLDDHGLVVNALPYQTSNLNVPRGCFALNGEDVGYVITGDQARESQLVSCDGGPRAPHGPYAPEGPAINSDPSGWHRTETALLTGQRRYLAVPGASCDPQYSLKTTYCAEPGVRLMQANPDMDELDMIAARHPVRDGDILTGKEVDQWVMKRKSAKGFKADSRWFDKSYYSGADGCYGMEDVHWYVEQQQDGLFVTEKELNRCGAPMAPVPADVYEAYGDDYYIVDCGDHRGWRDHHDNSDGCFDQARDYLVKNHRSSATVVVLNERARIDDHLYDGGYVSYDVADVSIDKDGKLSANRLDNYTPSGVYMSNCSQVTDGPAESHGFVIVRSMGISWARAYSWMNCPVY